MGLLSFRRGRKAPSPVSTFSLFPVKSTEKISDCLPPQPQNSELLDWFSQEVGSATSASGWVMPDFIFHRVVEYSHGSSTSQSPRSSNDSFEDPFLHLRGGNMDYFDECDPNSPTALERYTSWIDHDYYNDQCALRQDTQNTHHSVRQISPPTDPRFNPRISSRSPQQVSTQYAANSRFYPQVFCPSPSIDDSDEDEEVDEFTNNGHGRLVSSPGSFTDAPSGSSISYYFPDTLDSLVAISPSDSSSSAYSYEACGWDSCFEKNEEVEPDWVHVQNRSSDGNVIGYYFPDSPTATDLNSEYNADSEARDSMWDSNRSILQGLDLPDYEKVENWNYIWNPNSLGSSVNQAIESDFWSASTDLRYLISRVFGFFEVPFSPVTAGFAYDEDALPESNDVLADQSQFSPASVYSDNAQLERDNVLVQQHPFSPFSPTARNLFSPPFAWPPARPDSTPRLQYPTPFTWSWINRGPEITIAHCCPRPRQSIFAAPKLAPTIFDRSCFERAHPARSQVIICRGRGALIFGTGIRDQFLFTFKRDEPPFPPVGCLCRLSVLCHLHPNWDISWERENGLP